MAGKIKARPLSKTAFADFGDVIETRDAEQRLINTGTTTRFHNLAGIDVADQDGRPLISIFRGQPFVFPVSVAMMERHPLGSQAFFPLANRPFLVIVAPDEDGRPGTPAAFLANGDQGVNYGKNVWHHPLLTLDAISDFLVVDRGGPGANLQEYRYPGPFLIVEQA
jgi:ureidoglycolate lyase